MTLQSLWRLSSLVLSAGMTAACGGRPAPAASPSEVTETTTRVDETVNAETEILPGDAVTDTAPPAETVSTPEAAVPTTEATAPSTPAPVPAATAEPPATASPATPETPDATTPAEKKKAAEERRTRKTPDAKKPVKDHASHGACGAGACGSMAPAPTPKKP